jgi:hypothetical protein
MAAQRAGTPADSGDQESQIPPKLRLARPEGSIPLLIIQVRQGTAVRFESEFKHWDGDAYDQQGGCE